MTSSFCRAAPPRRIFSPLAAALLACAAWPHLGALCAQEVAAPPPPATAPPEVSDEPLYYRAAHAVVTERTAVFLGDVEVRVGARRIRCDSLVVWHRAAREAEASGLPGFVVFDRSVEEIYAEGTVLFNDGREDLGVRCDRLYLDLRKDVGLILRARVDTSVPLQKRTIDVQVRAEEIRVLGRARLEALQAEFAATSFDDPALEVTSERIVIVDDSTPGVPARRIEASGNRARYAGIPVLWLPDFAMDDRREDRVFQIEDVRLGQSSEFGFTPGVTVGTTFGDPDHRWHFSLDADYLSKRGFGVGPNLEWTGEDYIGQANLRYQRDRGVDRQFGPPGTRDRGRASFLHRHQLPGEVLLDLEAHAFSDRGYYPTFEERLDKTEKPPETLIHVRRAWDRQRVAALFSHRSSDFFTTTEARPELRYDLVSQSLGAVLDHELLLNATARVGNLRRRTDEALDIPQRTSTRADLDTLLETSFPLGPLRLRPFAGVRTSWYEEDLRGSGDRARLAWTHGASLSTDLARDFEAQGGFFDLDGLRHRILPEITYQEVLGVEPESQDLIAFDEVEEVDEERFLDVGLRQLLLTRRPFQGGTIVDTVLDLEVTQRFQFTSTPRDDGDLLGPLDVDLLVRLGPQVDLTTDFEYDWDSGFEVFNAGIGWIPDESFQAFTGYRFFEDVYQSWFLETRLRLDEKWLFRARTSVPFDNSSEFDHRVAITRQGREWVSEFVIGYDGGEDDFFVGFSLVPLFLWDADLEAPVLTREPRFGPIRDRLYR